MKYSGGDDINERLFLFFFRRKCFRFNYNIGEVRMAWNQPDPVLLLKKIELPDFILTNFSVVAVEQVSPVISNL